MSLKEYARSLCKKGHLSTSDDPCFCGESEVWSDIVEIVNGISEVITELEVIFPPAICICGCGNKHEVQPVRYRIPGEDMTPEQGARKLFNIIGKYLNKTDDSDSYLYLWPPEDSKLRGYGDCWSVCWEEGPWEWAINLSLGNKIYGISDECDILNDRGYFAEPYNSFVLGFYKG